jgi:serine beta-lactamase-like protein LACTB
LADGKLHGEITGVFSVAHRDLSSRLAWRIVTLGYENLSCRDSWTSYDVRCVKCLELVMSRLMIVGWVLLLTTRFCFADTIADLPAPVIDAIESRVSEAMSRQGIPGMSVAVSVDNELKYANGFGQADVENSVPARADSLYRTASIAKPMTATVVMQLAEQGKLDLDAPVWKYCREFPEKTWPVTSRQLLAHLGGVRHYNHPSETVETQRYFGIRPALAIFADDPLLHEPGTKYHYTTYGYNVVGAVAECVAEKEFCELLRERVLEPAGMHDTQADDQRKVIPGRVSGYIRPSRKDLEELPAESNFKAGELYNAALHDTSSKIPGGGLLSTAPDLVRFANAMNTKKLVKEETLAAMWTSQKTNDAKETNYGLGWRIGKLNDMKTVSHGGGQAGTSTYLLLLPDKKIAIAVMCNLQGAKVEKLAEDLAQKVSSE